MSWNAPATTTVGQVVTAAFWNQQVRDNMLDLDARTNASSQAVAANESRTSTTFGDLTTVGPAITMQTGSNALIAIGMAMGNTTVNDGAVATVAVSGATTISASTMAGSWALAHISSPASSGEEHSAITVVSGLTAGSNVFTIKYRADLGGTAFFIRRWIVGWPANKLS